MNIEEQKKFFKTWLQETRSIRSQTLIAYTEDVLDKLLEIINSSKNVSLKSINPNMYSYQTIDTFDEFVKLLKREPSFDVINKTGQPQGGWVSTPLNHYRKFLISNRTQRENKKGDFLKNIPLNQILYGPPGTGKTYNTVIKAMSIIDNTEYKEVSAEQYKALKTRFDELKKAGQIEFVTFHQSYSYEEFVEGIKPELQNEDNLKYVLENGIFKEICKNATKKITDNFEDVYNNFINEVSKVDEDDFYKLYTLKNHKIFGLQVNGNNNLNIYMTDNFNKQGVITKENLKKHFENMRVARDWINYYDAIIEHLKNNYNLVSENTALKPHVLIIDEINRGNISKIFGELITLIEDDKRENLSVKLPYSQESFTVPKNLYIIGTMNTSDRSIASIDIALRRRFKFVEMMPQKELVADFGIRFADIFENLNTKIKILLDRDHQIGHSYFIKTKYENAGIDELKTIWFSEILPLLNEYFYCDWEKLKLVVPGFIKKLDVPGVLKNECDDSIYEFKTLDEIEDFEKALNQEKFE